MPDTTEPLLDPFERLESWLRQAEATEPNDPNAMALATASASGHPSVRMVLLKGIDGPDAENRGVVFYSNRESRKGTELALNPFVALLFHWKSVRRQIRIEGEINGVGAAEADAYFASRPRISRLGAWASAQSRPLAHRSDLERQLEEAEARYPDDVIPRPPYWIGYRVVPSRFEFWQDMPYRLHDRTVYEREPGGWSTMKLYP